MKVNWSRASADEMRLADRTLKAAEILLENKMHEDAVSRAYDAVLHAAKAALAVRQQAPPVDHGVHRVFEVVLVNSGYIEGEYAKLMVEQQACRDSCDSDADFRMTEDGARCKLEAATRFLERVACYLKEAADPGQGAAKNGVVGPKYRWRQGVLMHRASSNHRSS
jgi:uncharacterized protein (UPF0332 family)